MVKFWPPWESMDNTPLIFHFSPFGLLRFDFAGSTQVLTGRGRPDAGIISIPAQSGLLGIRN